MTYVDDITIAINTLMRIQKNLRKLVGFEIDVKLENAARARSLILL